MLVVPKILLSGTSLYSINLKRNRIRLACKELKMLSIALGRYRFHVGSYPTNEEGLKVLAYHSPFEWREIRRKHSGWDGPYIRRLSNDPWGKNYVYKEGEGGDLPILFSCGPDREAGTSDDLYAIKIDFYIPFYDTSWTNEWMSAEFRELKKVKRYIIPVE